MKSRMAYLMNAPWGWARQRIHYLAEEMNRAFAVEVCEGLLFDTDQNLANTSSQLGLRIRRIRKMRGQRLAPIRMLNAAWRRHQLSCVMSRCDYVWVTHPTIFPEIEAALKPRHIVIYDCMDDALEFPNLSADQRAEIERDEQALVRRAQWIFCSSDELRLRLERRYSRNAMVPCRVVNNGITFDDDDPRRELGAPLQRVFRQHKRVATYIGTVSAWLDRDLMVRSLQRFPELVYLVVGPADVGLPRHERIIYHPPVEHADLFPIMARSALLVMPFCLNELVKAVNPVKLYEYIYSGQPVIATRYPETARFEEYIYSFGDENEYVGLLDRFAEGRLPPKMDLASCRRFAAQNTWRQRGQRILDLIQEQGPAS